MLEEYGWPEPTIHDEYLYESAKPHLPYLEERVRDEHLELLGDHISNIIFEESDERGGYYDGVTNTIYIHARHDPEDALRNGISAVDMVPFAPIVHEAGHALHDAHGLSLFNTDYFAIDNREVPSDEWELGVVPTNQFCKQVITLWESFKQQNFDRIRQYQERNISEFIAVAFEQWVTNPEMLLEQQPAMTRFFDNWFGCQDTFGEFSSDTGEVNEPSDPSVDEKESLLLYCYSSSA